MKPYLWLTMVTTQKQHGWLKGISYFPAIPDKLGWVLCLKLMGQSRVHNPVPCHIDYLVLPRWQSSVPPLTQFHLEYNIVPSCNNIHNITNLSESDVMECENSLIMFCQHN